MSKKLLIEKVFSYTYIHLAKKQHATFKADRFSLTCERGDDAGVCYHVLANVYWVNVKLIVCKGDDIKEKYIS